MTWKPFSVRSDNNASQLVHPCVIPFKYANQFWMKNLEKNTKKSSQQQKTSNLLGRSLQNHQTHPQLTEWHVHGKEKKSMAIGKQKETIACWIKFNWTGHSHAIKAKYAESLRATNTGGKMNFKPVCQWSLQRGSGDHVRRIINYFSTYVVNDCDVNCGWKLLRTEAGMEIMAFQSSANVTSSAPFCLKIEMCHNPIFGRSESFQ